PRPHPGTRAPCARRSRAREPAGRQDRTCPCRQRRARWSRAQTLCEGRRMRWLVVVALVVGCGGATPAKKPAPATVAWPLPPGWRTEMIPFPLDFAPTIQHTGAEVLRFPSGFFEPASGDYWAYAFIWRSKV